MANITVRNIPDSIFGKLQALSTRERRSLNNELLIAIENGVLYLEQKIAREKSKISVEMQASLWKDLAGKWKDKTSKGKLIRDIYASRTLGRDVAL